MIRYVLMKVLYFWGETCSFALLSIDIFYLFHYKMRNEIEFTG